MKLNDELTAQAQDFFSYFDSSKSIKENTRILTTSLVYSEHFDYMNRLERAEMIYYIHKIEDLLIELSNSLKEQI